MGSGKADWGEGSNQVEELKQAAKEVVVGVEDAPALLRLIDALQRLGIAHYFRQEIHHGFRRLLPSVAYDLDLFHTSLQFRLLRQHDFPVTPVPEREFSKGRKNLVAYGILATVLDDMYDIQGSIDDLQKFTHAINLWNITEVNELPDYMKVIYSAIVENGDQTARDASEHLGLSVDFLPYIKEQWASYCRALMVEAKWAKEGYMPSFDDYMHNAWVSIGIVPSMVYTLLAQANAIAEYLPDCLNNWANSELFYWPCFISRLVDDLASTDDEMERGEPNAMVCYMVERGVSQEEAKVHMRGLLNNAWTRLMELGNPQALGHIPNSLLGVALSMCRSVQTIYLHGDWFGARTQPNQDCLTQHLFSSIC
nr:terpene synthase 25 [Aquilaria agallochum]